MQVNTDQYRETKRRLQKESRKAYWQYLENIICYDESIETVRKKYKCLGNTIDGNIFNKHNDQGKKTLVKRIFFTCMKFIKFNLLCFNLIL
jgi:hypothetical protein